VQIVIEGSEGLNDGVYGSYAALEGDILRITIDPERDPAESAYPITVGTFA